MARSKTARLKERSHRTAWRKRRPIQSVPVIRDAAALGLPKVSECLIKLVEEFEYDSKSDRAYDTLISIAAMAWNASLEPPEERERVLLEMLLASHSRLGGALRAAAHEHVRETLLDHLDPDLQEDLMMGLTLGLKFIDRKLELYPDDTRMVVKHWFECAPDGIEKTLKVMSTLSPDALPLE